MNCPKCNSENTQTFEMAFSHGANDVLQVLALREVI